MKECDLERQSCWWQLGSHSCFQPLISPHRSRDGRRASPPGSSLISLGYSRMGTCQALSRCILRGEFLGSQLMRSSLRKYVPLTWPGSVKIRTGKLWLHPHLFWTGPWSFSVAFWNSTWLFTSCFALERIPQPDVETELFFRIPAALPDPHWPIVQQRASI